MPSPEGFLFSSCYRPASDCFWISNLKLECRGGYELSRPSFAMLISWCPRMSHAIAFNALRYSDPGYVERSWRWFNDFEAEAWVYREGMGERGSNPFSLKFVISCDLLPRHRSALAQPSIDRDIGLSFEYSFSWKVGTLLMSINSRPLLTGKW